MRMSIGTDTSGHPDVNSLVNDLRTSDLHDEEGVNRV